MSLKTFEAMHSLLRKQSDKPGIFVLVPLFVMPLVLGTGCTTDPEPETESVPFEVLRESASTSGDVFHCSFNSENIDMGSVNQGEEPSGLELVIDNPEDFATYLTCAETVEVDFSTGFILGGISTPQGNFPYVTSQTVRLSNGVLYYEVLLVEGAAAQPGSASYAVKVLSRDYLEYPVVFDVRWAEVE